MKLFNFSKNTLSKYEVPKYTDKECPSQQKLYIENSAKYQFNP